MTSHDSAATTRKRGQFTGEAPKTVVALSRALTPPSSEERWLAVMAAGAWAVLVAVFFVAETFLSFAFPTAMVVGAIAGAIHPRGPLAAALAVVVIGLLLCFAESHGTVDYLVLAFLVCLPVLAPALWLGAWTSAVAVRHWRTRHLLGGAGAMRGS